MKVNLIQLPAINGRLQQPIPVAAGQVIRVQVVKTEGNQAWLQLGGHVVKAEARVALNKGDSLQLQVARVQPDLIEMKVIPNAQAGRNVESILPQLGLPNNSAIKEIIAQMIHFGLPLSPAAVQELYTFIKSHQFKQDVIQTLTWLKSIGLKTTRQDDVDALAALHRFLRGDMTENEEIRFFQFLNQTANEALGAYNISGWPMPGGHIYLISQDSRSGRPSSENTMVLLRVDSDRLQELWFKLQMAGQYLHIGINCSNEEAREIIQQESVHLQAALQSAGYQLGPLTIRVQDNPATVLDFIPGAASQSLTVDVEV